MSAHPCPKCEKLRKVDIFITPDGWIQPPCYNCGDPGYLEPFDQKILEANANRQDDLAKCYVAICEIDYELREWRLDLDLCFLSIIERGERGLVK